MVPSPYNAVAIRSVQRTLLGEEAVEPDHQSGITTFQENLSLPVHRWYRYPAGFSGRWVEQVIGQSREQVERVFDPFAGTGTTLIAAQRVGVDSLGLEPHPFVSRVAEAKLLWSTDPEELLGASRTIVSEAKPSPVPSAPALLAKCFPPATLQKLEALRRGIADAEIQADQRQLLWLCLASILRRCSPVGTAQWQYILPNKRKAKVDEPFHAFRSQLALIVEDMRWMQRHTRWVQSRMLREDARSAPSTPSGWADLVVTSPPYPNNYDYADATRLEMTFFGDIRKWGDLQGRVRPFLIRSCSQHMASSNVESLLSDPILASIQGELAEVHGRLGAERKLHGGKKAYHSMVVAYFHDLARAWIEIRRVTRIGGRVCFVIGDSAPYGIYVPVDRWLGELAVAAGFKSHSFTKLRDRNLKWLNRKHRVPLKEGLLWVEG